MDTKAAMFTRRAVVLALAATLGISAAALAQVPPPYGPGPYSPPPYGAAADALPAAYGEQDLERMLAPVALYPDPLLMHVLVAATYPLEVRAASRWLRSNPGLAGEQAVALAAQSGWDASVQALCAYPEVVAVMEEHFAWTESLGEAFLAQQPGVMDAVQRLRQRAWAAGTLQSGGPVMVSMSGPWISIEAAQPQSVFVPYYDPLVAYGAWWIPVQPVRWRPWPGYAVRAGAPIVWGPPRIVSAHVVIARPDWNARHVTIVRDSVSSPWIYAPEHRRGEPYRHDELRRRFAPQNVAVPRTEPRREGPWDHAQRQQGPWDRAQGQQGPWDRAQGPRQEADRDRAPEARRGEARPGQHR